LAVRSFSTFVATSGTFTFNIRGITDLIFMVFLPVC
jgi:hypothetical protein